MPNAKVLSEKQAIVAELTEKIQKATSGVIVDYKGITVEEDTALRKECRESNVDYAVVKNTLLRFAFNNTGLNELDGLLNGTTSLALSEDAVAPARVMADYAKKSFGMFGGKEEKVKLLVDNSLAGVMIDRFGKDIIMVPGDGEHFTVNVTVHVSSQFLGWIFSLGEKVKILGPEEVIQAMRREGERLTEQYR